MVDSRAGADHRAQCRLARARGRRRRALREAREPAARMARDAPFREHAAAGTAGEPRAVRFRAKPVCPPSELRPTSSARLVALSLMSSWTGEIAALRYIAVALVIIRFDRQLLCLVHRQKCSSAATRR